MTALNLLLIVVFVASVIYGMRRGVILQVGSVGAVLAGILACRLITPLIASWLISDGDSPQGEYVDTVITNVAVFLAAYFGTKMLARALSNVVKILKLKPLDRIAGAIFSLFEWMLALSLVLNLANVIMPGADIPNRSRLSGGRAITAVMDLAPDILGGLNVSDLMNGDTDDDDDNNCDSTNVIQ